jgi:phospholipase C
VTSEVSDHTSIIQFLERWTDAIGTPAICPNISDWRRRVCGDLTRALDFTAPIFGLPELPATTVIGDPPGGSYAPPVTSNAMPAQEAGTKPARPLPYQPNANLDGLVFGANGVVQARLSFSNNGTHVTKASHFAVYDNAGGQSFADYPMLAPGQYTVDPAPTGDTPTVTGSVEIGAGSVDGTYDLSVFGPNRFLRRFTGQVLTGDTTSQVRATYYPNGSARRPRLILELINNGAAPATFAVAPNNYSTDPVKHYTVPPQSRATHQVDPLKSSRGWYDVSVTLDNDKTWLRRYVGHLEDGAESVTG